MNLLSRVAREIIENGECEIRIRVTRDITFGELEEKLRGLLLLFPPDRIRVVPIRGLAPEEELEILEEVRE